LSAKVGAGFIRTMVAAALSIGAAAVVAMGALTVTLAGTEAHAVTAHLSGGGSSTQTTPPSVPQTPVAIPPVKAKKWQGNGWQGQ
jgi:hypothetical protein